MKFDNMQNISIVNGFLKTNSIINEFCLHFFFGSHIVLCHGHDDQVPMMTRINREKLSKNQQYVDTMKEVEPLPASLFFLYFYFNQILWWLDLCTTKSGHLSSQALNATFQNLQKKNIKFQKYSYILLFIIALITLNQFINCTSWFTSMTSTTPWHKAWPSPPLQNFSKHCIEETKIEVQSIRFHTKSLWQFFLSKFFLYTSPQNLFQTSLN